MDRRGGVVMVKRYLELWSLDDVVSMTKNSFPRPERIESISVFDSVGRITATPLYSRFTVPVSHVAAMDGLAARSRDTIGANDQHPVTLQQYHPVNTGNIIPPEFDAVIMIEDVWEDQEQYLIRKSARPWQHVRMAGEEISESGLILPAGHQIGLADIGPLVAYGITNLDVHTIKVGLIPTGSELVQNGDIPKPGQVVESNTVMAAAWLSDVGATCTRYPITGDDPEKIREVVRRGVEENDMLIISAGTSAGTRDFTAEVIGEMGEVLVHGIAMKPGKPAVVGEIDGKPVFGLPGYPIAAQTVVREIIRPLLEEWRFRARKWDVVRARLTQTLASDVGYDEFVLLTVAKLNNHFIAMPQSRGSGIQMAAVRANAYLHIPAYTEGIEAGSEINVQLSGPKEQVDQSLLVIGTHDPALDQLAVSLKTKGIMLHSSNVGNLAGIISLRTGGCHGASVHLLTTESSSADYYLREFFSPSEASLIHLAAVEYGLLSREPVKIADLPSVRFINRQADSTSRDLIDRIIADAGLKATSIPGYSTEVRSHLAVAGAIQNNIADAGIAPKKIADAFGLVFTPLSRERQEIAVWNEQLDDRRMRTLIQSILSSEFQQSLEQLGGYDLSGIGTIREIA
jgi:putative molybdopterin biosynthesis protein